MLSAPRPPEAGGAEARAFSATSQLPGGDLGSSLAHVARPGPCPPLGFTCFPHSICSHEPFPDTAQPALAQGSLQLNVCLCAIFSMKSSFCLRHPALPIFQSLLPFLALPWYPSCTPRPGWQPMSRGSVAASGTAFPRGRASSRQTLYPQGQFWVLRMQPWPHFAEEESELRGVPELGPGSFHSSSLLLNTAPTTAVVSAATDHFLPSNLFNTQTRGTLYPTLSRAIKMQTLVFNGLLT